MIYVAFVPIIGQNSNGDFRSLRMKHFFRLDPLATRPPELSSQDVQRFHIRFWCWQLLTLLGCLTSENPSTCLSWMRKKLKHGTKMVSLDLELALQNPERQRKHIQKSYKNHMNLCVLCISVNISYMTVLLSHKGYTSSIAGFHGPEPLAWAETTFSPHRPGGRTGVSMTPAWCPRKLQETCRMHFMSRYDEKPGIINAQNAGYAFWFISDLFFVLIFIAC